MKTHLLSILAIIMVSTLSQTLVAQEQPKFDAICYQESNGDIYWNLKLPVYVQISALPDMKNPSTLKKVRKDDMKKYANPMYFDGSGDHYIKHIDYESPTVEKEIAYTIHVDGVAPISALSFNNSPKFYSSGKTYFGQGLTGTISPKDDISGILSVYESNNGAAYTEYQNVQNFTVEGDNVYKYFSVDKTGNVETPKEIKFIVDLTSPSTSSSVAKDFVENILSPRSIITLQSSDNLAGVKKTLWKFDGNKDSYYSEPLGVGFLNDGEHKLIFSSTDNVENKEIDKEYAFYLDKTAPVISSSFEGVIYKTANKVYIAEATKIALSATDNKAGVKDIEYTIDGPKIFTYNAPFNMPSGGGHMVLTRGTDNVQNIGDLKSNNELDKIYMDKTAPSVSYAYVGTKKLTRDTMFIKTSTNIKLLALDGESGVAKINYTIDKGTMNLYNNEFTIPAEGLHHVDYSSADNVENSRSDNFFFIVDNTGPEIFYHMSLQKIGSQKIEGKASEVLIYPIGTSFYLAATDKLVGTKAIYFTLNNLPERLFGAAVKLETKGMNTLKIRAVDELGNEKVSEVYEFIMQ